MGRAGLALLYFLGPPAVLELHTNTIAPDPAAPPTIASAPIAASTGIMVSGFSCGLVVVKFAVSGLAVVVGETVGDCVGLAVVGLAVGDCV